MARQRKEPTFTATDPGFPCGPGNHRLRFDIPGDATSHRHCVNCSYRDHGQHFDYRARTFGR